MKKEEEIYLEFLQTSKKTGISIKKILDVFYHLLKNKTIENNKLIKLVGVSKNGLNKVKKALSIYLNPSSKNTFLKKDVIEIINKLYHDNFLTEEDLLKTLITNSVYKQSIILLSYYKNMRPIPKRNLDQFTATIETTAKRTVLIDFLGDIKAKKILFLGDDDFTSLTTANIKSTKDIVVLDIDERILNNIKTISDKLKLEIKTIKHDLRKPIPKCLKGKFDVVFTDPPYTPEGVKLFLSRAIDAIDKNNETSRIYFCYGNSDRAKERFLPIQNIIINLGLMIRWVFDKFNRYEGAESIGSTSSLYVAEITPKTKSLILGNYEKQIYTND